MSQTGTSSGPLVLVMGDNTKRRTTPLRRALGEAIEVHGVSLDADVAQRPTLAMVELSADAAPAVQTITRLHGAFPDLPIIAVAETKDPDLILRVMRAGAREFLLAADEKAQMATVREFIGRHSRLGQVVSLFSTRGGVGCTTLAVNIAGAMAQAGKRVCLVDLEFHLGNVGLYLDIDVKYCVADVLQNVERLDTDLLQSSMSRHGSGVWVLSQMGRIEDATKITTADVARLLGFLRRHFDVVVVDGVRGVDERSLAIIEQTDSLLMIINSEMAAVKNAQFVVTLLRRLGYDERRVRLVLNRSGMKAAAVQTEAITEFVRLPIGASIDDDYASVARAVQKGALIGELSPRARVWQDITALATSIAGETEPKRKGLLRLLFGGGGGGGSGSKDDAMLANRPERAT